MVPGFCPGSSAKDFRGDRYLRSRDKIEVRKLTLRGARSSRIGAEGMTMKKLSELVAWVHRSDFRTVTFWTVLCGGILIGLWAAGSFEGFLTSGPIELGGPIAKR
jgi:hypothetical protein